MTGRTSLFVARDASDNGTTPVGARLALGGLLAGNGSTPLDVRPGVLVDNGGALVSGASDMSYNVRAFRAVSLVSAANGPTVGVNDATVNVTTTAAPGSNSRIDVIWARQHHVTGDGATDTDVLYEIGVTQGTVAASPSAPAVPAGAIALYNATVTSGVTGTSGLTFTRRHAWTVANGGIVPIFSSTERDAIDPYEGMAIWYSPTQQLQVCDSAGDWSAIGASQANPVYKARLTTAFSVPSGGDHLVNSWVDGGSQSKPGTGVFSYSAGVLTCLKTGMYSVHYRIRWSSSTSGSRIANVYINGTDLYVSSRAAPAATGAVTHDVLAKIYLTAGQTLSLYVSQSSGSTRSLEGEATSWMSSLSCEYMGVAAS